MLGSSLLDDLERAERGVAEVAAIIISLRFIKVLFDSVVEKQLVRELC